MIAHTQFGSGSPNSPFSYLNWHLAFLWSSFSNYKLNSRKQEIIQITSKYTRKKKTMGKESACNAGDLGLTLGLGRFSWRRERKATPTSILAWRIPWTIQFLQLWPSLSQEIANTSSDSRRRQRHLTLVLLPGKSHGRRSLVGCSPWGR